MEGRHYIIIALLDHYVAKPLILKMVKILKLLRRQGPEGM